MEVNIGRATAGASQIYCVVRPEWSETKRECNGALAYFSENFYPHFVEEIYNENFDFFNL